VPDVDLQIDIRHFVLFLAIENRQSKFEICCGGIAQLVERQLCKLEVRGSNPLASSPESFRGYRAEALAKADIFWLAPFLARATTRQASYEAILLCLHFAKRSDRSS
jgi:hypothetical protein